MQELTIIRNDSIDDDVNSTTLSITLPTFKRHFGNNLCFLYIHGEPLITIGPHCIKI